MASTRKAFFVVGWLAVSLPAQHRRATAAELAVAISLDIPPYVMAQGDKGLESELLRAALPEGSLRFLPMPYADVEGAVPAKADIAVAVREKREGVFYSREFLSFVNDAITKKASLFAPQSPERRNYVAVADQSEQVRLFWKAAAAVIVIDRAIFAYVSEATGHSLKEVEVTSPFLG